jgi:hypothetical protein
MLISELILLIQASHLIWELKQDIKWATTDFKAVHFLVQQLDISLKFMKKETSFGYRI